MKKTIALLVAGFMVVSVAGCTDTTENEGQSSTVETSQSESAAVASSVEEITAEVTTVAAADQEEVDALLQKLLAESDDEMPSDTDIQLLKSAQVAVLEDNFTGKWSRTNCLTGMFATVNITKDTDNTASVNGFFYHYGNVGNVNVSDAFYLNDNCLVVVDEDSETLYLLTIDGDTMTVTQHGDGNMGQDVTGAGEYTLGDPVYTNANDIEDNFTDEEIEAIKALLEEGGLDYTDFFENTVLYGILTVTESEATFEDGSVQKGTWYEAIAPHGFTYDSIIFIAEDGEIYFESTMNGISEYYFLTTNDAVSDMPVKE